MRKFQKGDRVAIVSGYSRSLADAVKGVVKSVAKNGNFTLEGERYKGQHRPTPDGRTAYPTGQESRPRYSHIIYYWDDDFEELYQDARRRKNKQIRWISIRARVAASPQGEDLTEEEQALIEQAYARRDARLAKKDDGNGGGTDSAPSPEQEGGEPGSDQA